MPVSFPNVKLLLMKTRLIVVAIIENKEGQILLGLKKQKRGVFPGTWHNLGGGVEKGETLEQALRREVKEESCLEIESFTRMSFSDGVATKLKDGKSEEIYHVFLGFFCKTKNGKLIPGDEFEKLSWFAKKDLAKTNINPFAHEGFVRSGWIKK